MTRKRRRQVWLPMPPKGMRPMLKPSTVADLALVHHINLDLISKGKASEAELWEMVAGVLTWSRVATALGLGEPEMAAQLELATCVVERYGRLGRIGYTGLEYQAAKVGVQVMDELARLVDHATATVAAEWAEVRVNELSAACRIAGAEETPCGAWVLTDEKVRNRRRWSA